MSEELHEFYKAYLAWATASVVENDVFDKGFGLCLCFTQWAESMGVSYQDYFPYLEEMRKQFKDAGLDQFNPFCPPEIYRQESMADTCHLNKNRIQWVKDHV